jgi:hypothetical protein
LVWPAPRGRGGLASGFAPSPISEFPVERDSPRPRRCSISGRARRRRAGASGRRCPKCHGGPGGKVGVAADGSGRQKPR